MIDERLRPSKSRAVAIKARTGAIHMGIVACGYVVTLLVLSTFYAAWNAYRAPRLFSYYKDIENSANNRDLERLLSFRSPGLISTVSPSEVVTSDGGDLVDWRKVLTSQGVVQWRTRVVNTYIRQHQDRQRYVGDLAIAEVEDHIVARGKDLVFTHEDIWASGSGSWQIVEIRYFGSSQFSIDEVKSWSD